MSKGLVSVVVPVYNISEHLGRCLESLASQTYEEIEVLLIDDGSTDESPKICLDYVERFDNFRYFRKENGGLSDARNFGIEKGRGEFVSLVDGDDYVASDFIELLVKAIDSDGVDISVCSYQTVCGGCCFPYRIESETVSGVDAMKRLIAEQRLVDVVAWNKLYRKTLFDSIRYPVGKLHEDVFTTYRLFADSQLVRYIDSPAYRYVQRGGSIMASMSRKRLEVLDAENEMRALCDSRGIQARMELEAFSLSTRISLMARIAKSGKLNELAEEYRQLRHRLSLRRCLANPFISSKQTLVCLTCKAIPQAITLLARCRSFLFR